MKEGDQALSIFRKKKRVSDENIHERGRVGAVNILEKERVGNVNIHERARSVLEKNIY